MPNTRLTKGMRKNGGIVKLEVVVKRLQKRLRSGMKLFSDDSECDDASCEEIRVPTDVKEGHFAVIARDDDDFRRFVVPLSFLTDPSFSRLLELAAEEYGFEHDGAVTVPCRPAELERILAREDEMGSRVCGGDMWSCSFNKTTVFNSH